MHIRLLKNTSENGSARAHTHAVACLLPPVICFDAAGLTCDALPRCNNNDYRNCEPMWQVPLLNLYPLQVQALEEKTKQYSCYLGEYIVVVLVAVMLVVDDVWVIISRSSIRL